MHYGQTRGHNQYIYIYIDINKHNNILGTLNNQFWMDALWFPTTFQSKDLESSNWNNQKTEGCLEVPGDTRCIYIYILHMEMSNFHQLPSRNSLFQPPCLSRKSKDQRYRDLESMVVLWRLHCCHGRNVHLEESFSRRRSAGLHGWWWTQQKSGEF